MALWPFGRKKRKAQREYEKGENDDDVMGIKTQISGPEDSKANRKGRGSKSSSKPASRKVSKSRDDAISQLPPPPPVPSLPRNDSAASAQIQEKDTRTGRLQDAPRRPLAELKNPEEVPPSAPFTKEHNVGSQTSLQPEDFTVLQQAPTLRPSRGSTVDLPRRKSSKRKADAKAREKEIRSMTSPIPIPKRPRSYSNGPLARDTKEVPGGLDRRLSRPTSQVSLPLAESLRSSLSGDMQNSFRVSAFDALAPRPTIRYSENPRLSSPMGGSRTSARKDKGPIIPEEDFSPKARIDNLADDMDASSLRELMERDKRRRERKKKSDREKLEKKLQRRLEKQKALLVGDIGASSDVDMPDATNEGTSGQPTSQQAPPVEELREIPPAEAQPAPASTAPPKSPGSWLQDPSREQLPNPEDPFVDPNQSHLDLGTDDEREEPVLQTAQAIRLSTASLSPPASPVIQQHTRAPSGLSQVQTASTSPALLEDIPEPPADYLTPDDGRRDSEASARDAGRWRSFFKRGGTNTRRTSADKGRANTPSEFSNTSRESFVRQNKQPPPVIQRSFKPKDGVPRRTRSKFREDLPELPISPLPPTTTTTQRPQTPQSPHSPGSPTSPYIDHTSKIDTMNEQARVSTPLGDVHPAFREEVALSRGPSMRATGSPQGADAALLSQSLASVDSEGSWLSGRPPKRSSIPISSVRESVGSMSEQIQESDETPEQYFSRQNTSPGKAPARSGLISQWRRAQSGDGQDDEDDDSRQSWPVASATDEQEPKYAAVHEGKATLVSRSPAFKSREGLLDMFNAGEESQNISPISSEDSASTPTEVSPTQVLEPQVSVHRATSINMSNRHSRQVSAGSARLLDIPARTSSDMKRSSVSSSKQGSPLLQSESFSQPESTTHAERPGVERFETAKEDL